DLAGLGARRHDRLLGSFFPGMSGRLVVDGGFRLRARHEAVAFPGAIDRRELDGVLAARRWTDADRADDVAHSEAGETDARWLGDQRSDRSRHLESCGVDRAERRG